ncbi:MAG: HD-GYP domain-containing protein [Thermacetogeniaceae bacterium]
MEYEKIAGPLRNPHVLGHSLHVFFTAYSLLAALPEGVLTRQQERDLLAAALLHDIGKAVWPQDWHEKPLYQLGATALTVMRAHPIQGANTLLEAGIPPEVARLVKQHHERPGGKGYPLGVDPPFDSVLLAACDVFCACLEKRPYKQKECTLEEALRAVAKFAPGQVVKALATALAKGRGMAAPGY